MRVFHELDNIAGIPLIMAKAERSLGIDSLSVCFPKNNYTSDILEERGNSPPAIIARIKKYVDKFDVFVFHFGSSLASESLADIPLLKKMGKAVVFYFHGCDIRQSEATIKKYKISACNECLPQRCNRNRDLARDVAFKYADRIWVSTPDLLEFVPRSELFVQPIDLSVFPYENRGGLPTPAKTEKTRIVHAPSDRALKGTKYIIAAIEALQREGLPVELLLLEKIPHAELVGKIREADFAVDQLLFGSYGTFSVELMAQGIPTICYLREDVKDIYPKDLPLVNANPETIKDVIRYMEENQDQW